MGLIAPLKNNLKFKKKIFIEKKYGNKNYQYYIQTINTININCTNK